ncbi:hypothetical protein ABV409_10025 [Flagellimonas sp. DF-77]|uniref:DUF6913 domain-containing protein n=1 Tax=Flagellimonas algarum TaxID=3230298 RepID=UPI00339AAEC3
MVFKAIQDKFKVKSGLKFLEDELAKPRDTRTGKKGIHSLGCIVDLDQFETPDAFYELRQELSLRPNAIQLIGYHKNHDKNSPFAVQFYTDRDLGWNGSIENGYVAEFTGREYDVLISYYAQDRLLLHLLTAKTKARIKVGFGAVDAKFNDLIMNMPISDFTSFKQELKKYLKILNEI